MRISVLMLLLLCVMFDIKAQQPDTLLNKLDSLYKIKSTNGQANNIHTDTYTENVRITFPGYFVLLGSDLKQDITAPFHLTKKQLFQTSIYTGAIITLQACSEDFDEPIQKFALRLHNSSKSISGISRYVTKFGGRYELYSLAALSGYGFIFNNKQMQTTVLLATQAYLTSGLIESGVKYITGRQRPSYYNSSRIEAEPTFHGPAFKANKKIDASFPSGHTTVIFAAATVFAKQYSNTLLIPIIAYSAATLVGLSRITENKHWTTDVIVGAALGYLCGNEVVNNYHRYTKIKNISTHGVVSFNINYNGNNVEPGFVYNFR